MFDLAVYVAVTSVHPLRVYLNVNDIYIRINRAEYHPFDPTNKDKYILKQDPYGLAEEKLPTFYRLR